MGWAVECRVAATPGVAVRRTCQSLAARGLDLSLSPLARSPATHLLAAPGPHWQAFCSAYARWRGAPPSPGEKGVLGGAAALCVTLVTMPLENVTKRLQAQGRPGFPRRYSGGLDCASQVRLRA